MNMYYKRLYACVHIHISVCMCVVFVTLPIRMSWVSRRAPDKSTVKGTDCPQSSGQTHANHQPEPMLPPNLSTSPIQPIITDMPQGTTQQHAMGGETQTYPRAAGHTPGKKLKIHPPCTDTQALTCSGENDHEESRGASTHPQRRGHHKI